MITLMLTNEKIVVERQDIRLFKRFGFLDAKFSLIGF